MTKLQLVVELEYDETMMHGDDPDAIKWFFEEILAKDRLILHSNEIGDEIGEVNIISIKPGVEQLTSQISSGGGLKDRREC